MPATYEPIATQTLGTAAASITFSSIPSTYTDLRLVVVGTASGGSMTMYFNADVGSPFNYSSTIIYGDGTTAASQAYTGRGSAFVSRASLSNTVPELITADIFSYAGSTYKTFLATASQDLNGSGEVNRLVSLWRSTAAINSLTISTTSFNTGTTATLYGIKAA